MKKINVGIIEDEAFVRESLISLFSKQGDLCIHSQAGDVHSFLANHGIEDIQVLLLDINLPGISGLDGMSALKKAMPQAEIVILTTYEDEEVIFQALCNGASAYLSKRSSTADIVKAVHTVLAGGSFMSPYIARKVIQHFTPVKKSRNLESLTPRQNEILEALKQGYSYKMIGEKLHISVNTVSDHVKAIYSKLHVHSKGELLSKGLKGEL